MRRTVTGIGGLERYFQQCAQRDAFSGVAVITQGSAQLFAGAYGYASRSWNIPNTLTTRFYTASITKLFTSVSTLQLIERGCFSFYTSIIEWLRFLPEKGIRWFSAAVSVARS